MVQGAIPPIVDLSLEKSEIVEQLMEAATTSGFMYIANSGVPQTLIDQTFAVNKCYFALPAEEKAKLPQVDWAANKLTGHEMGNRTADGLVREAHFKWSNAHAVTDSTYPPEQLVPGFKETTEAFIAAMVPVFNKILECYALGLGFPEDFFREMADPYSTDNHSTLVVNHYPSVAAAPHQAGTARITAHTDEPLITLLFTSPGSAGLELAAGKDGRAVDSRAGLYQVESWNPCPHIPGCITVNIGDALQAFSDGLLKSNYHRVRMPEPGEPQGDRYSLAYFAWPSNSTIISGPRKLYPPISFERFMEVKSKGFSYVLSPDERVYAEAQTAQIALGMPDVQPRASVAA